MCGIAGIVSFHPHRPIFPAELQAMAHPLTPRGPDGSGFHISDNSRSICGLAHRRLAIIDLPGGGQPLANAAGTHWIVYNGECYNYRELREQLKQRGYIFRTASDTEVVLALYETYGPDCINHIRGMFAFAVWDGPHERLFLARDRLGQKPLYFTQAQDRWVFASELKSILAIPDVPRIPDQSVLGQYLLLGYVPPGRCAFANIHSLPPAHTLTIDNSTTIPEPLRYWSLPEANTYEGGYEQAIKHIRAELTQAVRLRLVSDVPLGAFLSGGVDSTIIVGLMNSLQDRPVTACSMGFTQKRYNELPYARMAAQRYGCNHFEHIINPNVHDIINILPGLYDEPFADSSALPTWYLSRHTRAHVTVALSGDGGDEAFGGYDRYRAVALATRLASIPGLKCQWLKRLVENMPSGDYRSKRRRLQRFVSSLTKSPGRRYLSWVSLFDPDYLQSWIDNLDVNNLAERFEQTFSSIHVSDNQSGISAALSLDRSLYLPGDLNVKVDRASMAVGLEVRSPFQDHRLLELAASLPTSWHHDGRRGKCLLRQACSDLLPTPIARRPKAGFGVPIGRWFRQELHGALNDILLSQKTLQRSLLPSDAVRTLLDEHATDRHDHGHRLWALLMLELWRNRWLD